MKHQLISNGLQINIDMSLNNFIIIHSHWQQSIVHKQQKANKTYNTTIKLTSSAFMHYNGKMHKLVAFQPNHILLSKTVVCQDLFN